MSFTHTIKRSWASGSLSLDSNEVIESNSEDNRDIPVPGGATAEISINLIAEQVKSVFAVSNIDCTITTNFSAPSEEDVGDTIELKATVPYIWSTNSGFTNPFTVDVTSMFLHNGGGEDEDATVQLRVLQDSIPD